MTENTFQVKLEELRQQFHVLQQFSQGDRGQAAEPFGVVLAGVRRSLNQLESLAAAQPALEDGHLGSARSATTDNAWSSPTDARSSHGLRSRTRSERGPILVRILRTHAQCRWVSRAWIEFTGCESRELLEDGWLQYVHPEDRERCLKLCREAFDSSRLYRVEYRLKRRSGEYSWMLEIGTPRSASEGSASGYLGTAIEITEYKQAETRLALQYEVASLLSEAEILEEVAAPILQSLCESLGWDLGELWSVDPREQVPRCAELWASPSVDMSGLVESKRTRVFPDGSGPPWQSGEPMWIADIATDEKLAREPESCELGLHAMFRQPIEVHGEIRAILRVFSREVRPRDADLAKFMASVGVQIGQFLEHERSVERIRESEARKSAVLEASLDAVITIDPQGEIVEFNSAAENTFGIRREAALGRALLELIVPPRLRTRALAVLSGFWSTGEGGSLGKRFNSFAMKSDGSEIPVEVALAPSGIGDRQLLTIYVCDATARMRAEQELLRYQERLRSLMADLLVAEEKERRQLAVDLHDGLSQTIALAQIKLSALRTSLPRTQLAALDEIKELIREGDRTARAIGFELSPPVLHDLGLEPAVQWLVENIQSRYGIEILLEDDGQPKPADEKTRVILFRSIREILINAAKHAGARRVHVCLERDEDQLSAAIMDDGVGMEPDIVGAKGSGLFSIRERLSHVGGSMHIESAPGKGTKIQLRAPLTFREPKRKSVEA